MKRITYSDAIMLYASLGKGSDYTVRVRVKLKDEVDGELLEKALRYAEKRYPYLLLEMKRNESGFYYEENSRPVAVINDIGRIALNAPETNFHMWAVCYKGDVICFDCFHGTADGTGWYEVIATLLYHYCSERYGNVEAGGIRVQGEEIDPSEYEDPLERLPTLDMPDASPPVFPEAFNLIRDGNMTPAQMLIWDIEIPEKEFMPFTSANDASPATMVSVLLSRTLDELFPERNKDIIGDCVLNARVPLNAQKSHHNLVNTIKLPYSEKLKRMPFDRQCTAFRGMVFAQSYEDNVRLSTAVRAAVSRRMEASCPTAEEKMAFCSSLISSIYNGASYSTSYVGKWKYKSLEPYIEEFWTHPMISGLILTANISAVSGKIFLSFNQDFSEASVVEGFLRELENHGVGFKVRNRLLPNDSASFRVPEQV